jgi:hypothetical protein
MVAAAVMVALLAGAAAAHGQTMKIVSTKVPLPADSEPQLLKNLKYGYPWVVEFTSIRVDRNPEKNQALWTITATSDRAKPARVKIAVKLFNADGKDIAGARKTTVIKTGTEESEYQVKMKLKPGVWESAEQVQISVGFLIGAF